MTLLARLLPRHPPPDPLSVPQMLPEPRSDVDEETAAREYLDWQARHAGAEWARAHPDGKGW